jgi:hypothetical protein
MKNRKASINNSRYYLSAWGNENIIRNYIAYFEKKLEKEVLELKNMRIGISSAHYPNFAAWIRFYTELICNSLYWRLFRYEGDWKEIIKKGFNKIRDNIMKKIEQETASLSQKINDIEIDRMKESINLILNLRHSFQHGGLPNLMRDLLYKSDQEEFISMLNPNKYKETKEIFLNAEKLLHLLPQPIITFSPRK